MTDPRFATAEQAADPALPLQALADIAAQRPDLRAVVAGNPSAYPALLEWLGSLGDEAVDAALRARTVTTSSGGDDAVDDVEAGIGDRFAQYGVPLRSEAAMEGSAGFAPLGSAGRPAARAEVPYLPVPQPGSHGQQGSPLAPPSGPVAPAVGGPAPYAPGHPGAGQPPYGAPQPWAAPPPKRSNKGLWIALAVIGVLAVAVVAVFVALVFRAAEPTDPADLEAMYDACAEGDMDACDDLYWASPSGSEYEEFADTCGGRTDGGSLCRFEDFG